MEFYFWPDFSVGLTLALPLGASHLRITAAWMRKCQPFLWNFESYLLFQEVEHCIIFVTLFLDSIEKEKGKVIQFQFRLSTTVVYEVSICIGANIFLRDYLPSLIPYRGNDTVITMPWPYLYTLAHGSSLSLWTPHLLDCIHSLGTLSISPHPLHGVSSLSLLGHMSMTINLLILYASPSVISVVMLK